jgi:ABC-type transport system involved in multi-copper enzyme maturation permease subunit
MKTIIRREFLERIRSLQFTVLLVLTVVLFAGNGLVFTAANAAKTETYQKQAASRGQSQSTRVTWLLRRPNPLLFIAEGGDGGRAMNYTLMPKGTFFATQPNPRTLKLPVVPPLDWSFIIGALFSLYVILFGYNAVSGEKEDGTLRLVLSNPVGRVRLLTAKYVSIVSAAAAALLAGALVDLAIVAVLAPQVLTASGLSRIVLVLVMALAYVSLFTFLSLLVSALIHGSSLVLLTLLAVWVLFSVVIPSTASVLMEKLSSAPREIQAARMLQPTMQKEVWARIEDIGKRAERGEFKTEEEIRTAADRAFEEGQVKLNQFYEDFERTQHQRLEAVRNLSRLSPAAMFRYAAESLVQSGPGGEDDFLRQLREYSRVYDGYIQKKLGNVVQTSNFMMSSNVTFNGKKLTLHSPEPQEYRGDKSDFPKFAERRASLDTGLKSALGDLAGLIIWNIILAGLAFSAFLRTDVR